MPARSLSIVVPSTTTSQPSLAQSQSSFSSPQSIVLPSSYILSPVSSAAAPLPESMSLSRASSPSLSVASDCPESTLPSDECLPQPLVGRCASPAMSSFYLSPPLPPSTAAHSACPDLDLSSSSMSAEMPTSRADTQHPCQSSSGSQSPSACVQLIAQQQSLYHEKERHGLAPLTFSSLPSSSPSPTCSSTSSLQASHPSLVVPKARRLLMSHPYAIAAPLTIDSRHPYQQSDMQSMQQQQQYQQQLLAQQYMAALQHSSLPRYLPAAAPVVLSPSSSYHFLYPSMASSLSSYQLISTLPDAQPVGALVRV